MGFEELGKKLAQLGKDTKAGVQKASESYQLSSQIKDEKKALAKLFMAIGEAVYEKDTENAPEGLAAEFAAIKQAKEHIAELEETKKKMQEEAANEKLKDDAAQAAGEAGEILNSAMDKTAEALGGAAKSAQGVFSDLASKADSFFKGVSAKVGGDSVKSDVASGEAADVAEDVADAVEEVAETVAETAEEAAETVAEAAQEAAETATETVAEAAQDAVEEAQEVADEVAEEVAEAAEDLKEE